MSDLSVYSKYLDVFIDRSKENFTCGRLCYV